LPAIAPDQFTCRQWNASLLASIELVMPGQSLSKNGVASARLWSRASTSSRATCKKDVDGRVKPGHDE
jgi:hypothetical protein